MRFIVTTDSGCDLPLALLQQRQIIPIMLSYTIDAVPFRDEMRDDGIKEFYDKMRAGAVPKTSQLNPQEFVEFWRPLLSQGLPIVHIALGSGVSGTWHNGVTAARCSGRSFRTRKFS
ncbi:MAG: DegV family protein [Oscillospiraceae bacterium]|nr:DegV family protein [Oscillospiraceae bacterium]